LANEIKADENVIKYCRLKTQFFLGSLDATVYNVSSKLLTI